MRTSSPGPRPATASSNASHRAIRMSGSRSATTVLQWLRPARGIAKQQHELETRDPVTSPPLPVPDRIARGQPPPRLAATFFGVLVAQLPTGSCRRRAEKDAGLADKVQRT